MAITLTIEITDAQQAVDADWSAAWTDDTGET